MIIFLRGGQTVRVKDAHRIEADPSYLRSKSADWSDDAPDSQDIGIVCLDRDGNVRAVFRRTDVLGFMYGEDEELPHQSQ